MKLANFRINLCEVERVEEAIQFLLVRTNEASTEGVFTVVEGVTSREVNAACFEAGIVDLT